MAGTVAPNAPLRAWVWGGGALIASALLPVVVSTTFATADVFSEALLTAVHWIGMAAFAAAMLLFAFGWRGQGSVVGRAVPGMVALSVFGLWRPVSSLGFGAVPYSDDTRALLTAFSYIDLVVWIGAGLASVVAIGRARVLPRRWLWAPLWGFAAVVGVGVLSQAVGVSLAAQPDGLALFGAAMGLMQLFAVVVPLFLGILGVVLGLRADAPDRPPRSAVQVYPPEPPAS